MTGINLNVQNSYAALYSTSQAQTGSAKVVSDAGAAAEQGNIPTSLGEKLTLSAEAIALSQQPSQSPIPTEENPLGGGAGIRPPESSPLGGGAGIRPPLTS